MNHKTVTVQLIDDAATAWAVSNDDPNGVEIPVKGDDADRAMTDAFLTMLGYTPGQYLAEKLSSLPCVVVTHSWTAEDTQVYMCVDADEAAEKLNGLYNKYLAEEVRNGSKLNEAETFCDGEEYAKITWAGENKDKTEFIVTRMWKEV